MILLVQSDPEVPAGTIEDVLKERGTAYRIERMFERSASLSPEEADAVVVLGGKMGVGDTEQYPYLLEVKAFVARSFSRGIPFLGVCLGGQLLAEALGAPVESGVRGELGFHAVQVTGEGAADPLFEGISNPFISFQWHNDSFRIPDGATHLARTDCCPQQAFRVGPCAWGLQFHPEVNRGIVLDWSSDTGKQNDFAEEYDRFADAYETVSRRLLSNFFRAASKRKA